MIIAPFCSNSFITSLNISTLIGSKPAKGSSKINKQGLLMIAVINCIFCWFPLIIL